MTKVLNVLSHGAIAWLVVSKNRYVSMSDGEEILPPPMLQVDGGICYNNNNWLGQL